MDSHDESSLGYESEATPLLEENYRIGKKDYQYMCTSELPLGFTQELHKTEANRKSVPGWHETEANRQECSSVV